MAKEKILILIMLIGIFLVAGIFFISNGVFAVPAPPSTFNSLAYDLSDFPGYINNSDTFLIIGDNQDINDFNGMTSIASTIAAFFKCPSKITVQPRTIELLRHGPCSTPAKLASEVKNISNQNIISIGGPCSNNITAQIMDLPTTWPDCATGFEDGVGRIKIYNKWNKTQIIIAGYDGNDTEKAARYIANAYETDYLHFVMNGIEGEVFGKISNPLYRRIVTEKERYCKDDGDCVPSKCCGLGIFVNRKFEPNCTGNSCIPENERMWWNWTPVCINSLCDSIIKEKI